MKVLHKYPIKEDANKLLKVFTGDLVLSTHVPGLRQNATKNVLDAKKPSPAFDLVFKIYHEDDLHRQSHS